LTDLEKEGENTFSGSLFGAGGGAFGGGFSFNPNVGLTGGFGLSGGDIEGTGSASGTSATNAVGVNLAGGVATGSNFANAFGQGFSPLGSAGGNAGGLGNVDTTGGGGSVSAELSMDRDSTTPISMLSDRDSLVAVSFSPLLPFHLPRWSSWCIVQYVDEVYCTTVWKL